MKSQHGFTILIYLIAAAAVLAALGGIYYAIDSRAYNRGKLEITAAWEAANREATAKAEAERDQRARLADAQSAKLATAEGRARDVDTRWRTTRAEAARAGIPLVVASCPGPAGEIPALASGGGGLRMATSIRFTYQLLYDADSAWTGSDGQPVFGTSAELAERTKQPGSTASPIGPEELLGNWQENASRCSADRRVLHSLTQTLIKFREQWDKDHGAIR